MRERPIPAIGGWLRRTGNSVERTVKVLAVSADYRISTGQSTPAKGNTW
jgi:hypothetical protein